MDMIIITGVFNFYQLVFAFGHWDLQLSELTHLGSSLLFVSISAFFWSIRNILFYEKGETALAKLSFYILSQLDTLW